MKYSIFDKGGISHSGNNHGPFKTVSIRYHVDHEVRMEEVLNVMAEEGWEFLQAVSLSTDTTILIFRKAHPAS